MTQVFYFKTFFISFILCYSNFVVNQMSFSTKFRAWITKLNFFTDEKDESPILFDKQRVSTRIFLILITSKHIFVKNNGNLIDFSDF